MSNMKVQFNLLETASTSSDALQCESDSCTRYVYPTKPCFIDTEESKMYCEKCGKCMRYERKKAKEREDSGLTNTPLIQGLDY